MARKDNDKPDDEIKPRRLTYRIDDETSIVVSENLRNYKTEHATAITQFLNREGRMASILIERWGMVSGEPDGEDAAGRARLKPLSPNEVVERACDTASLACKAFKDRGWAIQVPSVYELEDRYLAEYDIDAD